MWRNFFNSLFVSATILCVSACQMDPFQWAYTRVRPKETDLVGIYVMDQKTRSNLYILQNWPVRKAFINIFADGSSMLKDLPVVGLTDDLPIVKEPEFFSGGGQWQLEKHQDWWNLNLTSIDHRYHWCFSLLEQKAPYTLHEVLGDPDSGYGLDYEKVENQTKK